MHAQNTHDVNEIKGAFNIGELMVIACHVAAKADNYLVVADNDCTFNFSIATLNRNEYRHAF